MNTLQKDRIIFLRKTGVGYGKITAELNLSLNTIKSFCRRNNLNIAPETQSSDFCVNCLHRLNILTGRKNGDFAPINAVPNGGIRTRNKLNKKQYIHLFVRIVKNHLRLMEILTENIVLTLAIFPHVSGVQEMNNDQFEREKRYQISIALAKNMLRKNIITAEEFSEIDTIFRAKYLPVIGGLTAVNSKK